MQYQSTWKCRGSSVLTDALCWYLPVTVLYGVAEGLGANTGVIMWGRASKMMDQLELDKGR